MSDGDEREARAIEAMARALHETWRAGDWPKAARLDKPYSELADADRDENRAAAQRVAGGLARIGLRLAPEGPGLDAGVVADMIEGHLEALAEAEHAGWMAHRAANGWAFGEQRDDAVKRHPSMIPYANLPEREKKRTAPWCAAIRPWRKTRGSSSCGARRASSLSQFG